MKKYSASIWIITGVLFIIISGLVLFSGATVHTALAQQTRTPDAPDEMQNIATIGDPTSITKDEEGYTVWTYEYPDTWCVMFSRIRWPFNLGEQDPSDLSETSLTLTFAEMVYARGEEGEPLYTNPTWGVGLNGKPGAWIDGSFTGDWNIIGTIGTVPTLIHKVPVAQEVLFDYTELIDGENNLWFQQQDFCHCEELEDCACTCYELSKIQLRARVSLGVKEVKPAPDAKNVNVSNGTTPDIRVRFTTMVSETTINENTFQVYYLNNEQEPVYVIGDVRKLSDVEYVFEPLLPLKDGIRYQARVWGESDALAEGHSEWVKDLNNGPLETGKHWEFWTLPEIRVELEPVQVLEDETLIAYKSTALRVFLSSKNYHPDVWYKDLWEYVEVEDIRLTWGSPSGSQLGAVSWRDNAANWHFAYTPETARRYRLNDKFRRLASLDSVNYYGFTPEETGLYSIRAAVTVLDSAGEKQQFVDLVTPNVVQTRWLNIHSRALAVGADYGKTGIANLSTAALGNRSGVQAIYPVPNVRLVQPASSVPYYAPVASKVWSATPAGDFELLKALLEMSSLCATTTGCDFMVGYAPIAWLVDIGLTSPRQAWYGMLVQNAYDDLYRFTVAHEGGHLNGFDHDTRSGGQGYDVRRRTERRNSTARMNPRNQKVLSTINSFMNQDPVESPPPERLWIEWRNYRTLISKLTTASRAQQGTIFTGQRLLATGIITPATGEIDLDPWYLLEPGEWGEPVTGPYRIVFLDSTGKEISGYTHSFTASTTLQPAGGPDRKLSEDSPVPFMLRVPFPDTTARIQIRRNNDDALLVERTMSTVAPTVAITTPASTTWNDAQAIAWQTDPGETRHFAVQISTDNGTTWEALAVHLPGTVYTIETTSFPNTTEALVRVIATDGLNTTSDTAGPFTIDNPLGVDYVSPAPGAEHVNVNQPLYAGFRDPIDPTTIHSGTFTLSGGPYGTVTGEITYDAETREVTFIPKTRLAYSTTYTGHISTGVYALDGTPLDEGATWSFTTEADFTPPRPQILSPDHGALNVPRNTAIAVTWDHNLEANAITTESFQVVKRLGTAVGGSVAYDDATQMATFTPGQLLEPHTTYVITLTAGITSTQGNATITPTIWTFTTGDTTPALALTGSYADTGVDTDGDGYYEYLRIRVGVQVTDTGDYSLRGTLVTTDGNAITWAYITTTLTSGLHILDLDFDGAAIGGHGLDGPYTLTDLTLARYDSQQQVVATTSKRSAYQTFAYPAAHFPAPLHFGGLPDVLVLPGTTEFTAFNVHSYAQHETLPSDRLSYTIMLNTQPAINVELQPAGDLQLSPEQYWLGTTSVTIRVSDGVYAVQDTFKATVGWPSAAYLPVVLRDSGKDVAAARSAWITLFKDDFESETLDWRVYASISTPPYGPGGWYWWDIRDCAAHSGEHSAWPYGGNDDGKLQPCGAEYPNTLESMMYQTMPANLKYVTRGEYNAKVWTNLAPGAHVCLNVAVLESGNCQYEGWPIGDYHGVCRSGQTNGWEDLTLNLANVPGLGNVLGEERVCISVNFWGGERDSGTRPEGAYVDDVNLRVCPEGLEEYCDGTTAPPVTPILKAGNIGGYPEDVDEAALAVDGTGKIHALWTGQLNPNFENYVFYSSSSDGVNWTPYQILNYWGGREPRIAVDNVHGRVHLAYANLEDGVIHHTVTNGIVSEPVVVAPHEIIYTPGLSQAGGRVAWPSLAVAEETGYAYLLWRQTSFVQSAPNTYSLLYRTWHAYWDGTAWSKPLSKINNQDTQYSTIVASPDGQAMLAWFQNWSQSYGDTTGPGDPMVARTAYGTEPGSFPLRQSTHDLYPEPERDDSIILAYSGGDDSFVLASNHMMWPGHSLAYRYIWKDGVWSEPLDVAENTTGWGVPHYVGAAKDKTLIHYIYNDNWELKMRTETNGALGAVQTLASYLTGHGYANSTPVAYFTDTAGNLHMIVTEKEEDQITGFYYVAP